MNCEVIGRCFPQVPFWLFCANEEGWAGLTWNLPTESLYSWWKRLVRSYFQADPLQCFLYQWIYICNSVFFKIFYCNLIIKNYLLGISLTQSWKKSFFCSDTWQMFLVLNGMGNKDKLCPLALQPSISLFSYTRFSSLSSDLLINGPEGAHL